MIYYNPIDSDPIVKPIGYSPRSCFVMTKLGEPIPEIIIEIREKLSAKLKSENITEFDASSMVTGRDFLLKIWNQILSVPLGIGVVDETMNAQTLANIFYEIGVMHAYGKETLIIKTKNAVIPSDFIRTEYVVYNSNFDDSLDKFFDTFFALEDYFIQLAANLEKNPLLSIDYIRRAYLISGNEELKIEVKKLSEALDLAARAKNSVESLITQF